MKNEQIVQDDQYRYWYGKLPKSDILEQIETGNAFFFQFKGRDYFIERGRNGYLIQDPRIGHKNDKSQGFPYIDYPGSEEAKTPEEMKALPFLDGKTIFERFDELRFFDH